MIGRYFATNGFWLCATDYLTDNIIFLGDVVSNNGLYYGIFKQNVIFMGSRAWDYSEGNSEFWARVFSQEGFWISVGSEIDLPTAYVGDVRNNLVTMYLVPVEGEIRNIDTRGRNWQNKCESGYIDLGMHFSSNGFWLCVKESVSNKTFYLGDLISSHTVNYYSINKNGVAELGSQSWDTCLNGSRLLGRVFQTNGFWLCMD